MFILTCKGCGKAIYEDVFDLVNNTNMSIGWCDECKDKACEDAYKRGFNELGFPEE